MDDLLVKLRLLSKAEFILLRLHLRRAVKQAAFFVVAAFLAVLAVAMLNLALYLYLVPRLEGTGAALVVALVDLVLAAAVIVAAGRMDLGSEGESAQALVDLTMTELASDIKQATKQISDLGDDIRQVRHAMTNFLGFSNLNLASVFQWIMMLLNVFRRRKDPS
jgi:hypothetical protein